MHIALLILLGMPTNTFFSVREITFQKGALQPPLFQPEVKAVT